MTLIHKISVIILIMIMTMTIFAPLIAPKDPNEIDVRNRLQEPSREHLLGTDGVGRDLLSRTIYGGRESILLALIATLVSMSIGLIIGLLAGYFGGVLDWFITTLSSIFQGIPNQAFMIALASVLKPGTSSIIISMAITSWVGFSRIVRMEVMKVYEENYIDGARSIGAGHMTILFTEILPNMKSSIIVIFASRLAGSVLSVSALSFLGLGIQPPTPDWGVMVSDARGVFRSAPMLIIAPGMCIFLLSFSLNMLGDYLRDRANVQRSNSVY